MLTFMRWPWPEYEAKQRQRGSLTLWIEAEALDQWQSIGPNCHARYRGIAIQNGASTNERLDEIGTDVDEPDDPGTGSHHGQPPGGGIDGNKVGAGAERADACVD